MTTMTYLMRHLWANKAKFRVVGRVPMFLMHYVDSTAHVPAKTFVKTILVKTDHQYWMVVVPSDVEIDDLALRKALQTKQLDIMTDADKNHIMDCRGEALSPFGDLYGFPVIVEKLLAEQREIEFNAGSRTDFIVMKLVDYERMVQPIVAQFAASSWFGRSGTTVDNIPDANSIKHVPTLLRAARNAGDAIPAKTGASMQRSEVSK